MLEEMLGCPAKDLLGQKVTDYVSEDDVHAQRTQLVRLLAGEERLMRVSIQYRRGDGNFGWANAVVSRLSDRSRDRGRFVVMVEDTTEQRRTVAALLQSEKLAATGRLVAGLAHEINNPLQAVIGCLGLAQEVLAEGEDAESFLKIATEELHRAAKLVRDLYEVYRPGDERREPVDLNALVHRVVDLTRRQRESGQVEVEVHLAEGLPTVMAVPDRMQQVMLNLVLNAVDAMPEGGQLDIRSCTSQDPESGHSGVQVEFRDNGGGVSADVLEHLFEPFTTTKEEGSGLGLFVCRTILEQHGGWIRLESIEGEGTAAIVWLPC
jgi:PAS domain S-box-containing protein